MKIFGTIGILADPNEKVDVGAFLGEEKPEEKGVDVSDIRKRLAKKRPPIPARSKFPEGHESLRKRKGWISPP